MVRGVDVDGWVVATYDRWPWKEPRGALNRLVRSDVGGGARL